MQKKMKAGRIAKLVFIFLTILFLLGEFAFTSVFPAGKQHFDLTSSVLISLGFGIALCLTMYDRKKR